MAGARESLCKYVLFLSLKHGSRKHLKKSKMFSEKDRCQKDENNMKENVLPLGTYVLHETLLNVYVFVHLSMCIIHMISLDIFRILLNNLNRNEHFISG